MFLGITGKIHVLEWRRQSQRKIRSELGEDKYTHITEDSKMAFFFSFKKADWFQFVLVPYTKNDKKEYALIRLNKFDLYDEYSVVSKWLYPEVYFKLKNHGKKTKIEGDEEYDY